MRKMLALLVWCAQMASVLWIAPLSVNAAGKGLMRAQSTDHVFTVDDLLLSIFDYYPPHPYTTLSLVSKQFHAAVEKFNMAAKLAEEADYEPFRAMEPGRKLLRLFLLNRGIMKGRLHLIFAPDKGIWPESQIVLGYVMHKILHNPAIDELTRKNHLVDFAQHFIAHHNVELFAILAPIISNENIEFSWSHENNLFDFAYILAKTSPWCAHVLLKTTRVSPSNSVCILATILFASDSALDHVAIISLLPHPIIKSVEIILKAIAHSCTLRFNDIPVSKHSAYHARNVQLINQLIEQLLAFMPLEPHLRFWIIYARLMTRIRFSDAYLDVPLHASLGVSLDDPLNGPLKEMIAAFLHQSKNGPRYFENNYPLISRILMAIICSGKRELFKAVCKMQKYAGIAQIRHIVKQHSDFEALLPASVREKMNSSGSLLESVRLQASKIDARSPSDAAANIKSVNRRLVFIASSCPLAVFDAAVKELAEIQKWNVLLNAILTLVGSIENPAPFVYAILHRLPLLSTTHARSVLGSKNVIMTLLHGAENGLDLHTILQKLLICPGIEFVKALLNSPTLAASINNAHGLQLRERFYIDLPSLVFEHGLSYKQTVKLLIILGVCVEDKDAFSLQTDWNRNTIESRVIIQTAACTLASLRFYAEQSGFFLRLAIRIGQLDLRTNANFEKSLEQKAPNPFLLKTISFHEEWCRRNHASFLAVATQEIVDAFFPPS